MAVQFVESGKMNTNFRKLNCMLSLWYGVIAGALQVYLIVQNVWKFVRFAELPWPNQQTPTLELNIFIGLNGFAVLLLPFFITACFLKIGNLANDNQMLGKRLKCSGTNFGGLVDHSKGQDGKNTFVSIWTHCGPISSLLHIICSVCLLFPQTLMDGILIKHGFLAKDDVWKSDLDFLNANEPEDMVVRPIGGDNGVSEFAKKVFPLTSKHDGIRLEFVNYAMAIFIFSIRYAQVFWSTHKRFAVILGLQQIVNNIHTLISFSTLIVLYKVHVASVYQKSTPFLLDDQMTMLIFTISLTVLFLSSSVLYYFGYMKFASFLQEKIQKQYVSCSGDSSFYGNGWAYFPHSAAVSIALALAAAQSPLVHDAFIVYQISSKSFLLAFPISSLIHFLMWAFLWLCLSLTKNWKFNITATIVQPVDGLETTGIPTEITLDLRESLSPGPFSPSLVVISEGKAFPVNNTADQKSILALIPGKDQVSEPTYWKKTIPTPTPSCLSYKQKDHSKIKYMPCRKEVTFDDELLSPRYYSRPQSRAGASSMRNGPSDSCCSNVEEFDAGEYAYLSGSKASQAFTQFQNHRSARANDPVYGQLSSKINFMERNTVSSPVSTVDSSSGVSSISTQSNCGPPSTSASCSQYSEGLVSLCETERQSIMEPTAHYEPVRLLSRRNSVRSYISSPQAQYVTEDAGVMADDIYGKLKAGKAVCRSESIYSSGSRKVDSEARFNRNLYDCSVVTSPKCNYSHEKSTASYESKELAHVSLNAKSKFTDNSKIYGYIDDIVPPIPPPLPILSCVVRKTLPTHSPKANQTY